MPNRVRGCTAILLNGMRIDFYLCTSSTLNRYAKSTYITIFTYTERELAISAMCRN